MSGRGEVYPRTDVRYAFRVLTVDGRLVAVDATAGFLTRADATARVLRLMAGGYRQGRVVPRDGDRFGFQVDGDDGSPVAREGVNAYRGHTEAARILDELISGEFDGPVDQV